MSVMTAVGVADRNMIIDIIGRTKVKRYPPPPERRSSSRIKRTKVKRYWPGKAPEWAGDDDDIQAAALEKALPILDVICEDDPRLRRLARVSLDVVREDDPRLRRLARINHDEAREERRRIRQSEIVSTAEGERAEADLGEDEGRRLNREKVLLQGQREEPEAAEEEVDEESDYSSEEEVDEESDYSLEEEAVAVAITKAVVFIPKPERETIAQRERLEAEERALEEAEKKRIQERKRETKEIVLEKIKEGGQKNVKLDPSIIADVDTDDDDAGDYEAGIAREKARIKREKEEREIVLIKRRRTTKEERRELERENARKPKKRRRVMHKDYHKGAFFQSAPDDPAGTAGFYSIYLRDFSAPTGEDKIDKTTLPKVMRVKRFGRSGRTKWTHLVEEDTTFWNAV